MVKYGDQVTKYTKYCIYWQLQFWNYALLQIFILNLNFSNKDQIGYLDIVKHQYLYLVENLHF